MTLFGEDNAARRDRLRLLLSVQLDGGATAAEVKTEPKRDEEEYYTDGSAALLHARREIAMYSLARARRRIAAQERQASTPLLTLANRRQDLEHRLRRVVAQGSQVATDRACAIGRFSPDGKAIATGSWSGEVAICGAQDLEPKRRLGAHSDRVGGVAWHPSATSDPPDDEVDASRGRTLQLMTSGADGTIALWGSGQDVPLARISSDGGKVGRIACHPMGRHLASASADGCWRLWDLATTTELLAQPGHSREVYTVSFQHDGALLCSAGLDAVGRVWDVRTGRTVMALEGHAGAVHGSDWRDDGYTLATASADDACKIWDLRKVSCVQTLPAHRSLVSDCRFFHRPRRSRRLTGQDRGKGKSTDAMMHDDSDELVQLDLSHDTAGDDDESEADQAGTHLESGSFLCTSGYDGRVNVWSCGDWALVQSLVGHAEHKVMSCDVSPDGEAICSTAWDRTVRIWSA